MSLVWIAPTMAIINRLRGAGNLTFNNGLVIPIPGSRYIASVLAGVFTAMLLPHPTDMDYIKNVVTTATTFLFWAIWGWDLYFSAYNGLWVKKADTSVTIFGITFKFGNGQIKWITWIGQKLLPVTEPVTYCEPNRVRGLICMSLRGMFIIPYFVFVTQSVAGIAWGSLAGLIMGTSYYFAQSIANALEGNKDPIEVAEWLTWLLIGTLVTGITLL